MPRAGSTRCWISSPSSGALLSSPACSHVALWPSSLPGSPTSDGSTAVPAGASKPYSRRAVLGPGAVGAGSMPGQDPRAAVVRRRVPLWARWLRRPRTAHRLVFFAAVSLRPGCSGGGGGGLSLPRHRPSSLGAPSPAVVTLGVSSPRGNSVTPGVSVPCGDLTPSPTPWQDPRGFSVTPEASRPPSLSLTPGESWDTPEALRPPSLPRTPEVSPAWF